MLHRNFGLTLQVGTNRFSQNVNKHYKSALRNITEERRPQTTNIE